VGATLGIFGRLLVDRSFVGYALACGLALAAMFAYIAGSPFVLQDIYGVSPQVFSVIFGTNAFGIMAAGQLNARLVGRIAPERLLPAGLVVAAVGGVGLLTSVISDVGLVGVLPSLFLVVASIGVTSPNATALALTGHPRTAGSASALLGVLQYTIGALAAPLVGLGGAHTAVPMGVVIAAFSASALGVFVALGRAKGAPMAESAD
jgi:DHA1 family bicyclomycin/chloramphenicol resistance-like MFS transporter